MEGLDLVGQNEPYVPCGVWGASLSILAYTQPDELRQKGKTLHWDTSESWPEPDNYLARSLVFLLGL